MRENLKKLKGLKVGDILIVSLIKPNGKIVSDTLLLLKKNCMFYHDEFKSYSSFLCYKFYVLETNEIRYIITHFLKNTNYTFEVIKHEQ